MALAFSVKDSKKWKSADKTENEIAWCLATNWMKEMEPRVKNGKISHSFIDECRTMAEREVLLCNEINPTQISDAIGIIVEHWKFGDNFDKLLVTWEFAVLWMQKMEPLVKNGEIPYSDIAECRDAAKVEIMKTLGLATIFPMQINDAKSIIMKYWKFGSNLDKALLGKGG